MWHIIILNVFIHLNVSYHLVRECVCVCICMEMWGELVQFHYDVCSIWIRWIFPSIQFVQSFAHVFTYNTIQFNVYLMCVCVMLLEENQTFHFCLVKYSRKYIYIIVYYIICLLAVCMDIIYAYV